MFYYYFGDKMKRLINTLIIISYMLLCIILILLFKDVLNKKELLFIISFLITLEFVFIYLLKKNVLLFFSYPCIIVLLIFLAGFGLKSNTIFKFVNEVVTDNIVIDNYRVLVLKNKYNSIDELNNKKIGYTKDTLGFNNLTIKFTAICYEENDEMIKELDNGNIDAAIILNSNYEYLDQEKYEMIYNIEFKEEVIKANEEINNTSLIYITTSDQNSTSKSDVNLIIGINNYTKQILLISIPKDYYVTLPSKMEKDRLSYASIYGINEAIKTVENIIQNKIDYFIKFDLNKIDNLIDELGGINVEVTSDFISSSVEFKKGINRLDGEKALIFARETRGLTDKSNNNTEKVIEALIMKITESNNYLKVLDTLEKSVKTNIPQNTILKMVKDNFAYDNKYRLTKYSLTGDFKFGYTYSYKCCKLNVIEPDVMSINEAITLIEYLKSDGVFN